MKVHLWQGEADRSVGGMGRYMAEKLPKLRGSGMAWQPNDMSIPLAPRAMMDENGLTVN